MRTRDEIIEAVRHLPFSRRQRFFAILNNRRPRATTGEVVAWPDAILYISAIDWCDAYDAAFTWPGAADQQSSTVTDAR